MSGFDPGVAELTELLLMIEKGTEESRRLLAEYRERKAKKLVPEREMTLPRMVRLLLEEGYVVAQCPAPACTGEIAAHKFWVVSGLERWTLPPGLFLEVVPLLHMVQTAERCEQGRLTAPVKMVLTEMLAEGK